MHCCRHLPPSCQAPCPLSLFAGQHQDHDQDTFTFDTRDELDEVVAHAEATKMRKRECERPLTVDILPSFVRAVVDTLTNTLSPLPLMGTKRTPDMTL